MIKKKVQNIHRMFFLINAIASYNLNALEISPLSIELKTDTKPSYQQIIIRNTSNRTTPVEITLNKINFNDYSEKNQFTLSEQDGFTDLLVFPPALVLEPGSTQAIRVQWSSDTVLSESRSYFIRFSQPQLSQEQDNSSEPSGVKVFVHFNAVVHVSSTKLSSDLNVVPNSIEISKDGKQLNVSINNKGQSYHYLKYEELFKLKDNEKDQVFLNAEQFDELGEIFFPPHTIRRLTFPLTNIWDKNDSLYIKHLVID